MTWIAALLLCTTAVTQCQLDRWDDGYSRPLSDLRERGGDYGGVVVELSRLLRAWRKDDSYEAVRRQVVESAKPAELEIRIEYGNFGDVNYGATWLVVQNGEGWVVEADFGSVRKRTVPTERCKDFAAWLSGSPLWHLQSDAYTNADDGRAYFVSARMGERVAQFVIYEPPLGDDFASDAWLQYALRTREHGEFLRHVLRWFREFS